MNDVQTSRDRLHALSADKRLLIERLLLARAGNARAIPVGDPATPAPLAPPQHRLWFMEQLSPGSSTYNAVVTIHAQGALDLGIVRTVLARIVDRHHILRTVIDDGDDGPHQRVLTQWAPEFEVVDASGDDDAARWDHAALWDDAVARVRSFARRPFDLTRELTLRVIVVRLGDDDYLIGFAQHHIAFDGWSDDVLFAELSDGYAALSDGRAWEPRPLAVQYGDVARWWRQQPADPALEQYWVQTLAGAPASAGLPTDRPRPAVQRFDGVHLPVRIDGAREQLATVQARSGTTAFMVLSAAFAAVLFRWTGVGDIVLGSPFANRGRVEFEPMIGFFSNTVPLRFRVSGVDTFQELVVRSREVCVGAFAHQEVPFERIVELSGAARDPRYNPLFQANVRVQQGARPTPRFTGVRTSAVDVDLGFSRFDIALDLTVGDETIDGYIEYNSALFESESIARLVDWVQVFIADALARPDVAVQDLTFGPATRGIRGSRRSAKR